MKLIFVIVRSDNEDEVSTALNRAGFILTKLNSTGGFLRRGNVTLMLGTEDDKVGEVIEIIRNECGPRQKIKVDMPFMTGMGIPNYTTLPQEIMVGGATVFVVDIDRYEHF